MVRWKAIYRKLCNRRLSSIYFLDFRISLVFEFLLNKCPNFYDFPVFFRDSLLFETVFYYRAYGMWDSNYYEEKGF